MKRVQLSARFILVLLFSNCFSLGKRVVSGNDVTPSSNTGGWYCGNDVFSEEFSQFLTMACDDREPLNECCKGHDACYDENECSYDALVGCDNTFGQCIRTHYGRNACGEWIYGTHLEATRVLGESYKRKLVAQEKCQEQKQE